jgi:hypothetical protein
MNRFCCAAQVYMAPGRTVPGLANLAVQRWLELLSWQRAAADPGSRYCLDLARSNTGKVQRLWLWAEGVFRGGAHSLVRGLQSGRRRDFFHLILVESVRN